MPAPTQHAPIEWRAALGGQFDSDSHGIADFGIRRPGWSIQLLTDTVDLRWTPHGASWHAWLGLRGEGGAAGLFLTPWTDGAPDPTRALLASYGGLEGGYIREGIGGLYGGVNASARLWFFAPREETLVSVPGPTVQVAANGLLGFWQPTLRAWVQLGGVNTSEGISPRASAELSYEPLLPVTAFVTLRAGGAIGADDLSRTRLGGMVPYVVPVAGAAWAEWWVEDYAAARLGAAAQGTVGPLSLRVAPFADLAVFDGQGAVGLGTTLRVGWGRFYAEGALGHAPWIPRGDGVSRTSVYALLGVDWGAGRIGP